MGAQITIYNNGQRMAVTNNAFATVVKKELMREWVLNFSVTNRDSARQYVIDPNAQFMAEGQRYDTKSYKQSSGQDNTTQVTAFHVLTRMNNYTIPAGYAFVGTISAIIQDILNISGASAEFTVGICAGISGSFSLGNTQPSNAFSAIAKLTALGVEPSYDNFTINAPVRWGVDTGKVFKFGRDLCSLERTFDKTTTPYTYSYGIDIANLQRIVGASVEFDIGDTAGIQDSLIGDSIIGQRIISYEKCLDDPTQDKVTIGGFISDMADTTIAMQMDISTSVQQATPYNNVDISHQYGFKSISANGLMKTFNNGSDGFAIQHWYNNNWVTVWLAESTTGKTITFSLDHMQKVEMGGSVGYASYKSDGIGGWIQTGGMTADGQNMATKLTTPDDSSVYGVIGHDISDRYGLFLYSYLANFFQILENSGGAAYISPSHDFYGQFSTTSNSIGIGTYPRSFIAADDTGVILAYAQSISNSVEILLNGNNISFYKNGVAVASW
jgi:hypothetical protein